MAVSEAGAQRAQALLDAGGAVAIVIDVDGCLTPGYQVVDSGGFKPLKFFGLDDRAAIERWAREVDITLVTSDPAPATAARARQLDLMLRIVPAEPATRLYEIANLTGDLSRTVYIGDGYYDHHVMTGVGFGIAPQDAWPETVRKADAWVFADGGRRAVALALDFTGENLIEPKHPGG